MALFFKCGIKCENHSGAVILVQKVFGLEDLYLIFSEFKRDRIDNQYNISIDENEPISKDKCNKNLLIAEKFNLDVRTYMGRLTLAEIGWIRKRFEKI